MTGQQRWGKLLRRNSRQQLSSTAIRLQQTHETSLHTCEQPAQPEGQHALLRRVLRGARALPSLLCLLCLLLPQLLRLLRLLHLLCLLLPQLLRLLRLLCLLLPQLLRLLRSCGSAGLRPVCHPPSALLQLLLLGLA